MKKIRVIFYKAKRGDGHWLDNAINFWTWLISAKNRTVGPYSHVEIQTANDVGLFRSPCSCYDKPDDCDECSVMGFCGDCWTSTMRGKDNGTVKRPANTVINNPDRWDYCEIELGINWYEGTIKWMQGEVSRNKGYSKRDLAKFFGLGFLADKKKNICSEFCNDALFVAGIMADKGVVSPRRLAWKLKKAGYQIKPLTS